MKYSVGVLHSKIFDCATSEWDENSFELLMMAMDERVYGLSLADGAAVTEYHQLIRFMLWYLRDHPDAKTEEQLNEFFTRVEKEMSEFRRVLKKTVVLDPYYEEGLFELSQQCRDSVRQHHRDYYI